MMNMKINKGTRMLANVAPAMELVEVDVIGAPVVPTGQG
jgi:hypothetical protein